MRSSRGGVRGDCLTGDNIQGRQALDHYVTDRIHALQRWTQRIGKLLCLARDLPAKRPDLQLDLQGLRDKRDEACNRLQQLARAPTSTAHARLQELEESWHRMVSAWNNAFRKLDAQRAQRGTPHA